MGQSTDGQICYGIVFGDDFSFPWGDSDIEKWWRDVNGYEHPFLMYDENGYIGGVKPLQSKIDKYYDHMQAWEKEHPLPIQLVNYCSIDYPAYVLAIPESFKNCSRGYPEEFNPADLKVTDEQKQVFKDFYDKYLKEAVEEYNNDEYISDDKKVQFEPKWYLTSYWG